jgi:hypothetical protein
VAGQDRIEQLLNDIQREDAARRVDTIDDDSDAS